MIVLSGADLVLPDRILSPGTLVIDGDRIAEVRPDVIASSSPSAFAFHQHYIAPAFVDMHVHGIEGVDVFDRDNPIARMAEKLPRYGVAAFCPTTIACGHEALARVLQHVRQARAAPAPRAARVLPAHLESNFISPEYAGAQPVACLRTPRVALDEWASGRARGAGKAGGARGADEAGAILDEIEKAAPDVGIVTIAPELEGAMELIGWLSSRGHVVSLGHSGASYDVGLAAISAGARQATHLFNRMPPLGHRAPGLTGAVLQAEEIAAELICDAFHVHPALVRTAVAAKSPARICAITDGTAAAGLPAGSKARLGDQEISAGEGAAYRTDGTLAGSIITMDRAFRLLVEQMGFSPVDAATMCATTPARELGLTGHGVLAPDAVADLVVLDRNLHVVQTYIGGHLVYARSA
jgi:N-acetylglucosamine-6-phosphate deacetylase